MNVPKQKNVPSLTADERQALRNHKRNTEVEIRNADKGSAVVIPRERYITHGCRQLRDWMCINRYLRVCFLTRLKRSRIFKGVASSPRIWPLMLFQWIENRLAFTFSQKCIRVGVLEDP